MLFGHGKSLAWQRFAPQAMTSLKLLRLANLWAGFAGGESVLIAGEWPRFAVIAGKPGSYMDGAEMRAVLSLQPVPEIVLVNKQVNGPALPGSPASQAPTRTAKGESWAEPGG